MPGSAPQPTDGTPAARERARTLPAVVAPYSLARTRNGADSGLGKRGWVHSVAGKLAEEFIPHMQEFRAAMAKARRLAKEEGFHPGEVRFFRHLKSTDIKDTGGHSVGEITDGALGVLDKGLGPNGKLILRVYAVFESKSPSNVGELARYPGSWTGQLAKDFERFRHMDIEVDGQRLSPDQVTISRYGDWYTMTPSKKPLSVGQRQVIAGGFPTFKALVAPVRIEVLKEVAELLMGLLESDDRPLIPRKAPPVDDGPV
jgi:hypothetical protein